MESPERTDNIKTVFRMIEEAVWDDNILKVEEFEKIKARMLGLKISGKDIYKEKQVEIERVLYQQLYLLLLDDNIDLQERKEIEYYKYMFGFDALDMHKFIEKLRQEKQQWKERMTGDVYSMSLADDERSRHIPKSIKQIVWDRDQGKCVLCGSIDNLHFDHNIPFSKGGSNATENIRVLCSSCNLKKGDNIE